MSKNLSEYVEIAVMWRAFEHAIADAESLLLFGFSLPSSDELLLQTIRASCSRSRKLKRVAAIDLDPEGVLDRFEDCLPVGYEVEKTHLPVVRGEIPTWLPADLDATFLTC